MKSLIITLIFLFISSISFSQKKEVADTTQKKDQKNTVNSKGDNKQKQDSATVHITPGASGVKRSIGYKFSSSTEAGDPGNGVFRFDNGVAADVKFIIVDDIDVKGEDQTNWYSTWDKNTGATGRGRITVADASGKVVAVYDFTSVFMDAEGFWKLPVKYVSGSLPSDGSVYYYVFERIAHGNTTDGNPQGNQAVVAAVVVTPAVVTPPVVTPPVITPPVVEQPVVVVPPTVVVNPPVAEVKDTTKIKETIQGNQAVVAAVVTTEVAAVTQTNNQVQVVVAEPPVQVQAVVTEPPVQVMDTVKTNPASQGNQVAAAAVVTAGTVVATQAVNPPRTAPVTTTTNREQTTQTTQTGQRTQTTQPTQSKPVTQTTQPTQSKPVTQTTPPVQTKPVTQTTTTTAAATTVAVQPAQKTQTTQATQISQNTQTTQQAQQVQSNQAVQPNNQPPAKQYNQFPVVQNIFASGGSGSGHRRWYRGIIEVGYGFGLGDYGINNFRFNFINAIRIGEFSSIGLGIGYRRYFTGNDAAPYLVSNVDQIPFFLDLRTSFSTRKLTPFAALGIGTSRGYRSASTDKSLFMFNASGGIWYNVSSRFAVFAGIAYENQKLLYSDTDPFANSYFKNAGSISLNIGISF